MFLPADDVPRCSCRRCDSAESLARNVKDARLSSTWPGVSSSAKPKPTQMGPTRPETTRMGPTRPETTQGSPPRPEFVSAGPGPSKRRSGDSPQRFSDYSSRQGSCTPPLKSRQGSDTPPRKRLTLWDDSAADEAQTSSHRQHRNDQQGDEEYFRHASLALLLDYIIRMFPAASNTRPSLLPNDFSSSRLPV